MKESLDASIQAKKSCIYKFFVQIFLQKGRANIFENRDLVEKSTLDKLSFKFP